MATEETITFEDTVSSHVDSVQEFTCSIDWVLTRKIFSRTGNVQNFDVSIYAYRYGLSIYSYGIDKSVDLIISI
jgi:hypothetical protein